MIRPFTCVCLLLAGGAGLYLYQVKHEVQLLDREIASIARAARQARERAEVLRAEWTLLNDPERLADLAARFLPLRPVQPGQFTTLADLDNRLPPVPVTEENGPSQADKPKPEDSSSPLAQDDAPKPISSPKPVPASQPTPHSEPPGHAAPARVITAAVKPPAHKQPVQPISLMAPARAIAALPPTPLITPGAGGIPPRSPEPAPSPPPRPATPVVGSALGMARTTMLPPPPSPIPNQDSIRHGN
ncbi:MAG: hypothetical protein JOY71_13990 [Acetobacteraceae bacterium]|nr:hypothetical protein [Acetobacteraceae bacterium]MBV8523211.1 hypothetical protein [Acetobacteraceae bacterium]